MKLAAIGIKRKGEPGFKIQTDEPSGNSGELKPGTYNKFTFAAAYPEFYAELIRAGMPAIGDGRGVLIEVK